MEMQTGTEGINEARLQEDAAVRVQAMNLQYIREQAEALARLQKSAETVTDPSLGLYLDVQG